jgi:hypothetical protein
MNVTSTNNSVLNSAKLGLILVARSAYNSKQVSDAAISGNPIAPTPSNTQLISLFPSLAQDLQALVIKYETQLVATDDSSGVADKGNSNGAALPSPNNDTATSKVDIVA